VTAPTTQGSIPSTRPRDSQWSIVGRQFRRKRSAVWGLRITLGLVLTAIFAPVFASGIPFVWKEPGGSLQFPWFTTLFDVNIWEHGIDRFFNLLLVAVTLWFAVRVVLHLAFRDKVQRGRNRVNIRKWFIVATAVVAVIQFFGWGFLGSQPTVDYRARDAQLRAEGQDVLVVKPPVPYSYRDQLPSLDDKFRGFFDFERGEVHVLGTDEIGRDIFARILYGTRISLTIGIIAVSIYVTIGTILGALAGYFLGKVDMLIMRLVEIMICIPYLFLLLTIVALFQQKSIFLIMFAIGIISWTGVTRLVRGEFIRERNIEYVDAARAMGFRMPRIVFRHILPNAMGPVLVAATFGVASAILAESGLSFLGMGDVTVPSWGAILNHGRENEYWHLIVPPSVAIFVTVTALNLVGDGLRDALDPKLRD
jgi:peptide/nickel transport system permease protein